MVYALCSIYVSQRLLPGVKLLHNARTRSVLIVPVQKADEIDGHLAKIRPLFAELRTHHHGS